MDEASGTVRWATGNALYGVSFGDGRRLWGVTVAGGVSTPTAVNGWFYVMTPDEGLMAINAVSGERTIVEATAQTISNKPVGPADLDRSDTSDQPEHDGGGRHAGKLAKGTPSTATAPGVLQQILLRVQSLCSIGMTSRLLESG